MGTDRCKSGWVNAVLTLLVALALLLAPAVSVQAMQCYGDTAREQPGFEHSSVLTKGSQGLLQGGLLTPDHKACCTMSCGFCLVLTCMNRAEALIAASFFLRFAWSDQSGSGMAFPPTLGPPRFPV